jgi:hypothetical protein
VTRLVLAFLAVMALLASPVIASAAQGACDQAGPTAMAGMAMATMDQTGGKTSGADPCCGHADHHGQKGDSSCAQACATTCGVAVALTTSFDSAVFAPTPATLTPAPAVARVPYEPAGLRRPPKSIA